MSIPPDTYLLPVRKPPRKRAHGTKCDRKLALQLAASGYYDSPKETLARAENYLTFMVSGPAKPSKTKRKRP